MINSEFDKLTFIRGEFFLFVELRLFFSDRLDFFSVRIAFVTTEEGIPASSATFNPKLLLATPGFN